MVSCKFCRTEFLFKSGRCDLFYLLFCHFKLIEVLPSMALKRQLVEENEEYSEFQNGVVRRRQILAEALEEADKAQVMEYFTAILEPMITKCVREEVDRAFCSFLRSSSNQIKSSGSRTWQLQFRSNLPSELFTNSSVLAVDKTPIEIVLYDSISRTIVQSSPLSSVKVSIVVLDGDFGPDDREDWDKADFEKNVVQNREGKRPLLTGGMTVTLKDGVGYIDMLSFTDNSSWIRCGKFRLGATVNSSSDEIHIREGMTNSFKVKDHRGESYQKHYPPSLTDEVWRLEKIAKDGASHKRLTNSSISTVGDFLRMYNMNNASLREVLNNISEKIWDIVIKHAITCTLDGTKYLYKTANGVGLVFNPIYKVIGATFDGQNFCSLDYLDAHQLMVVECLKELAYKNSKDWIPVCDPSVINYPMLLTNSSSGDLNNHNDQIAMQKNPVHPTSSPPYDSEVEHGYSSFETLARENLPEFQVFDRKFTSCSGKNNSLGGLDTWASGGNYIRSADDDFPIDCNFLVESSAWHGNGLFIDSANHQMISSMSRIDVPRAVRPKTSWGMILAVVKWGILVKRNRAARSWRRFNNYM